MQMSITICMLFMTIEEVEILWNSLMISHKNGIQISHMFMLYDYSYFVGFLMVST